MKNLTKSSEKRAERSGNNTFSGDSSFDEMAVTFVVRWYSRRIWVPSILGVQAGVVGIWPVFSSLSHVPIVLWSDIS